MSSFEEAINKAKTFWSRISFSQRIVAGVIASALVGLFFFMLVMMNQTAMTTLYSNLSLEDANRVVKTLEGQKIPYQISEGGTAILVPEDKVHSLRIAIAGEGSIVGQGIGFEVFDGAPFGQTDFIQKINYQRALQGELARTISEFSAVENARIHLVIPQRSLFIQEQQKPSASIVLNMRDGKRLDNKEVNSIVNLVSMAVEGLTKERISVTDSTGRTLFKPEEEGSLLGMTNSQFEHRSLTQQNMERRIEEMLSRTIGPGRVVAMVNADMDFSRKNIERQVYDPDSGVVISETRMEESQQGRANLEAGVPDVNFRGDGLTGAVSNQNSSREQRTTNYGYNIDKQNIISSVGEVSRLTISVMVDGTYTQAENGEMTFAPRTPEELKAYEQLISNAVGFNSARGDSIEVRCMPFGAPELQGQRDVTSIIADYALRLGKPFLNALLIFLFLIIIVRPVVLALIRPKVEGEMLEELAGLPLGEERLALVESNDDELDAMAILEKIEDIKAHAMHLSEQNMDQVIGILRNWVKNDTATSKEKLPAKAA